jgi:hypothetical protein
MRRASILIGILLFFSAGARAQGPAGSGGGGGSYPKQPSIGAGSYAPWQIAVGFQYDDVNLLGSPFNTYGANISLARYVVRWFGVEAQFGAGFGSTQQTTAPPNLAAKSLFFGIGPRLAYRNRTRFEPWAHVLIGIEHFRFSQTAGFLGTNNALAGPAGGGVDIYFAPNIALRTEADFIGSRFFSTNQRSFQVIGGVVINF